MNLAHSLVSSMFVFMKRELHCNADMLLFENNVRDLSEVGPEIKSTKKIEESYRTCHLYFSQLAIVFCRPWSNE